MEEEEESEEIPYVFDACPSTSDELRELINSVSRRPRRTLEE